MSHLPDMQGKVYIVSGANSGIGNATGLAPARLNATLVVACRSAERGQAALAEVREEKG